MCYAKHDCHCGPGKMWKPLKRLLSYWFNESCAYHDDLYKHGLYTKSGCDYKFLVAMLQQCDRWYKVPVAITFYLFTLNHWGDESWESNRRDHG